MGGWGAAHCARNVPSGRGSAQQCNVPAGMNVPKCESAQCGMCASSDTHSYYVTVALALSSPFPSSLSHVNFVVWKNSRPSAVLYYTSWWDFGGIKFKIVGIKPHCHHLKPRPTTVGIAPTNFGILNGHPTRLNIRRCNTKLPDPPLITLK